MNSIRTTVAATALIIVAAFGSSAQEQNAAASAKATGPTASTVRLYDPARDASADIVKALAEAQRTGKRVLLEVGGDWCPWCHILHDSFAHDPALLRARDSNFVVVPINSSPENKNETALARYGKVPAIPYFLVLDAEGNLVHGHRVSDFLTKDGYSAEKLKAFFAEWSGRRSVATEAR